MHTRKKRSVVRGAVALVLLPAVLFGAMLFFAKIESTKSGVHQRLMLPLLGIAHVKSPMTAGTGDAAAIPGRFDGPVVKLDVANSWSASWFCEDRVQRQTGTGETLRIACAGQRYTFAIPLKAQQDDAVVPMSDKLLVLSDIEGNAAFMNSALSKLGVTDAGGEWNFGANRLVIAGDSVDRGRDVFAVLWRLHGLAAQARAAGGSVHVLLGNHEQYLLRGNTVKVHPEHLFALEKLGGVAAAFGPDTVIGAWLREQPVMVKAGRVIVTHGGVSPLVAQQGLTIAQLNTAMRRYWRGEPVPATELEAVLGFTGVTQYRGYFKAEEGKYGKASDQDVAAALRTFDADTIVVGHSIVEKVSGLYEKKVYAINVNSNTAAPEALLFERGVATVVAAAPRALPEESTERLSRPINLMTGRDWETLARLTRRTRELSNLPSPF